MKTSYYSRSILLTWKLKHLTSSLANVIIQDLAKAYLILMPLHQGTKLHQGLFSMVLKWYIHAFVFITISHMLSWDRCSITYKWDEYVNKDKRGPNRKCMKPVNTLIRYKACKRKNLGSGQNIFLLQNDGQMYKYLILQ